MSGWEPDNWHDLARVYPGLDLLYTDLAHLLTAG